MLIWLSFISPLAEAQAPVQCETAYGVHDKRLNDTQIFAYSLRTPLFESLGNLQKAMDIEGLEVHPQTNILYASSGKTNAQLFTVDSQTGALSVVGNIGYDNVVALAFHPDGTLSAWCDQGLLQIDIATGAGTLMSSEIHPIQALTWNQAGTLLYAAANDNANTSTLLVYDGKRWQTACEGLPQKVEALETLPEGLFIYGFHADNQLGIHTYDVSGCQTLADARLDTPFNDIEGIAWPDYPCVPSNLAALISHLEQEYGEHAVRIQERNITVTLNGEETHYGQLAESILTTVTPPVDGNLVFTPIFDANNDGRGDFLITYPSGDQQVLYYYGILDEPPAGSRILEVPPIDPTVISIPALVTQFLYTGENPIQTGVAPGTIDLERAATLRGKVTTTDGKPLPNVIITLKDHPEYGQTVTTSDGFFNMAVNGGATLTVNYQLEGYLPLQRQIKPSWQEYAVIDDVVMTALDPQVSIIDLTANQPMQVAQGSPVTDEDGTRQAVVLFPQGLTALMTLADGSTQPLTQLDVRATEYTVGDNGPQAMPAPLPPASAYTYAVELSVDQAIAVGATQVDFSQPVPLYVDNFLNFPVGGIVPVGWYDRSKAAWVPSENGRVIEIIRINNGLAVLDVEGSGQAASASALAELDISEAERQQLASLYTAGKSLWRGRLTHFTPWDYNWAYGPPEDAENPSSKEPKTKDDDNPDDPCEQAGCIIEAESQVLGESLAVTGTPFSLNYRSNRVPGRKTLYTLEISLRGISVPASLKHIQLEITIAGQRFQKRFPVGTLSTTFVWAGKDAFGRRVQGPQTAKVRIGYVYDAIYYKASDFAQSFGNVGTGPITGSRARQEVTLWKEYTKSLGAWYPVGTGLGSLGLNIHQVYNPMTQILSQGNGKQRRASALSNTVINTVAGSGNEGFGGDGGLATQANLKYPSALAFGPDGNLYIADSYNNRIRRVGADGILNTVAGNGDRGFGGDGGLATQASLSLPSGIAVGPDGSWYIADSWNHSIRRVGVDGTINTVAGNGDKGFDGDGGLATQASLDFPTGIAFGPDGSWYIADYGNFRIRRVGVDGIISTVAGDGYKDGYGRGRFRGDGGLATQASLYYPQGIAIGPDGSLYIADTDNHRIRRVGPALPQFSVGNLFIPSESGALLYEFTSNGRHLRTLDSITGKAVYTFSYNENGYLAEIEDLDGDLTRIERDGNTPLALVAPDGQRTALTLDDNGYLNSVTNPAGEVYQLHYTADGLLTEFINPRGHKSIYQYDELGLFVQDTNAAGGGWTLARTDPPEGGHTTTMTTSEGRVTRYKVEPQSNGDVLRVNTSPNGTVVKTRIKTNGETIVTHTDGTVIVSEQGPDPRFGMQAPLTKRMTITTPNGLSALVTTEKTAELTDANNPLSVAKLTTKVTTNSRASQSVYDASNKTVSSKSAAGRQSVSYLDDKGRIVRETVPGLADVYYVYDNRGRLTTVIEGQGDDARALTIGYDSNSGYVAQITDALQRSVEFSRDKVGRVLVQKLPDNREIRYSYDANSNVASITPPSRPAHGFDYTEVDLQKQYTPPILSDVSQPQTQYVYNLDKQLIQIRRPDGQVIDLVYDEVKGRLNRIDLPNDKSVHYVYSDSTSKLETLTAPDGSTLSYTYDGSLPLSETWSNGSITGILSRTYDNNFRLKSASVNGGYIVNYQYDDDSLLTKVGDLVLNREAQNGFLTGTVLGEVTTQRTLNPFGELESEEATYQGKSLYQVEYGRDKLGRIVHKVETIEGETTTYHYRYSLAGQLAEVLQDVTVNRYEYDSNGNRLARGGVIIGHYDNQDRLVQYGENQYTYTENGELKTKTNTVTHETTSYTYDVFTNLTRVQLPDGTEIEYLIDGRDRRIGKKVNGQLVQGFLYQGSLNPVTELDANGNLVTRFVYGGRGNVPAYLIKNGQTFRVIADFLGSPRLVVNVTTGQIVQRMDYDEFGKVIEDTNPGFQPFGFAGGIYDTDTGLVRFGARDYDPETGRWTAKDPIDFDGGDANLYGYIWNDPINSADPSGLVACGGVCVAGVGIGIVRVGKAAYDAYRAYRAARAAAQAAQAVANEIGDDDAEEGSSEGEARPDNVHHPEDAADSISKAQQKQRKRDKTRGWDPDEDWGELPRPKGCGIDSTKKTTKRNWKKDYQ